MRHRGREVAESERCAPEETAIAFSYNRVTQAVMMASPVDLEDFAVGFSLTEGIVTHPSEILELEIVPSSAGVELRMWVAPERLDMLDDRRRSAAGPTGCGLCGIESLQQAMRPVRQAPAGIAVTSEEVVAALASLAPGQVLNRRTRAMHAAAFVRPGAPPIALREDVGRHNALDKLAGALARHTIDPANGLVVMTSRVSIELVQKLGMMGGAILVAVSAPTALAIRMAEQAGITLIGVARDDGFELFAGGHRLVD